MGLDAWTDRGSGVDTETTNTVSAGILRKLRAMTKMR